MQNSVPAPELQPATSPAIGTVAPVLRVPRVERFDDYVGPWAIEPKAAAALWELARTTDLAAHVAHVRRQRAEFLSTRDRPEEERRGLVELQPAGKGKSLAIIKVTGALMKAETSLGDSTSTVQLRRDVRDAARNPDVAAILLAFDSPGGTVAGTDDLARDVKAAAKKKPVYAQVEDLCASAAYWVASQCDQIFANSPTALVGSIGTIIGLYDLSGMAEKEGIVAKVFATGPLKGAGFPGSKLTEAQDAYYQGIVDETQKSFDAGVKAGRGLTDRQLADVRTGGVFMAAAAQDRKLIDGVQSLDQTVEALLAEVRRRNQQQANGARGSAATPSVQAKPATAPVEASAMFEQWLLAKGFDSAELNERQLANFRRMYEAEQQTRAVVAESTRPNGEGAGASTAPGALPGTAAVGIDELAAERRARAAETLRVNNIARICQAAGLPTMEVEQGGTRAAVDIAAHAIENGWSVLEVRREVELQQLRKARVQGPGLVVRGEDRDCTLQALQGAMILRAGGRLDAPCYGSMQALVMGVPQWLRMGINAEQRQRAMEWAHRYRDMSMVDLCRQALRLDGVEEKATRSETVRAAFSGGTLTNIFTSNINTILLATYAEAPDSTAGWTREAEVNDFKTNERPRLQKGAGLTKQARGKEADHASRSDVGESYKIARYTKKMEVDEQDFIDDTFNAFADLPVEMGRAAARLRPDLVYAILLANPTLASTGLGLFDQATQGNLIAGAALSAATLRTAVATMFVVQENGVNLNLRATHLLVPGGQIHLARELCKSAQIIIAGTAGAITERGTLNSIALDNLQPVADARLDNGVTDPNSGTTYAGSGTTWFLASTEAYTIEVGYLRGTGKAPQVRSYILDKGKWGMGWDIAHDIGAKALDWRGLQKNTA